MVYQTRAAHSSAKFRSYPLRNQRYCKEKRPQRYYKLPSVTGKYKNYDDIFLRLHNSTIYTTRILFMYQ